jgi:hypothetical protein
MELASVTKMPPQRLMLIVGGGVAAGLLWRKFSGKSAASGNTPLAADAADGSLSYPSDLNSLPMDTRGNTGYFPLPAAPSNGTTNDDDRTAALEEGLAQLNQNVEAGTRYNVADDVSWWQDLNETDIKLAKEQGIYPSENVQEFWFNHYGRYL